MIFDKFAKFYKDFKGGGDLKSRLLDIVKSWLAFYREALVKIKDLGDTNYKLGIYHLKNNNISDAILRFKLLLLFRFDEPKIYYYMAYCYMDKLDYQKGLKYLSLYKNSNDIEFKEEAEYYERIGNKKDVDYIPNSIIASKFDQLSFNYDNSYNKDPLGSTQKAISEIILKITEASKKSDSEIKLLDLGCGTGIIGAELKKRDLDIRITGVDLSSNMINKAKDKTYNGKSVYATLKIDNIISFLKKQNTTYEIIVLSDVIGYCADLESLLIELIRIMTPNQSIVVVSCNEVGELNINKKFIYKLEEFRYHPEFVRSTFINYNFQCIEEHNLIKKDEKKVAIFVFKLEISDNNSID
jgi:predicted TPR repeat methyltransferase